MANRDTETDVDAMQKVQKTSRIAGASLEDQCTTGLATAHHKTFVIQ